MSKLRFGNSMNEEVGLSRQAGSFTKKFMAMTGSAALVIGGAASAFIGASAASAATSLTSASYQIGTGSVSSVTATSSSTTASATSIYTISFVATNAIVSGQLITIASLSTGNTAPTGGTFGYSGSASVAATYSAPSAGTVTVPAPSAVPAGSTVTLTFAATNVGATSTTVYTPTVLVATSNPVAAPSSTSITINPAAATVTPTDSASPTTFGATATLTLGIPQLTTVSTGTNGAAADLPVGSTLQITVPTGAFTGNAADYTITDTTTGTSQTPTSATQSSNSTTNDTVTLVTSADIPAGHSISITAKNVTNPASGTQTPTIAISTAATGGTPLIVNDNPLDNTASTNKPFVGIVYGSPTAITGLTVSASPTTVSASSSYALSFKATTAVNASASAITITLASGSTVTAGAGEAVVTDLTHPFSESDAVGAGSTSNVANITTSTAISAGDTVDVTLLGVTNGSTAGTQSASVSTSGDTSAVSASYSLTAATSTTLTPIVTPSNSAVGVLNNYTITNVSAAAAYPVGATTGQISLTFPTGTSYPTAASQYTINDLTNPSASGPAATAVGAGQTVALTVSKAIASGDNLSIVVDGVTNPGTAALENMTFGGLVASTQSVVTFPSAGMTYPNGALVQSGGQIDVIAGGYAFGIPSLSALAQLGNSSTVVAGTFPTATAPRAGTLIAVAGAPGIWVVGTNGMIYQFSSVSQFLADGYSPMQVVEVPSAGGLTVGTGVPPTAAATMADGSVQNFGGTLYVFDGGVAFGIPNIATANTILAATGSTPIVGSGSAPMAGTVADGAILQVGSSTYVTSGGKAYLSTGSSQLASSGYSTMYAVQVPSLGSIAVA